MFLMNPTVQLVRSMFEDVKKNTLITWIIICLMWFHHQAGKKTYPFITWIFAWWFQSRDFFYLQTHLGWWSYLKSPWFRWNSPDNSIIFQSLISLIPWNDHFFHSQTPWNQDVHSKIPMNSGLFRWWNGESPEFNRQGSHLGHHPLVHLLGRGLQAWVAQREKNAGEVTIQTWDFWNVLDFWLVISKIWIVFHFIYGIFWDNPWDVILPIDEHSYFSEGWLNHQADLYSIL